MLPAPVFRATTAIQARRRLGLTATLVREDGKEVKYAHADKRAKFHIAAEDQRIICTNWYRKVLLKRLSGLTVSYF